MASPIDIRVDASELTELGKALQGPAVDRFRGDLMSDVAATAGHAQAEARTAAPVFRGTLANSIHITAPSVRETGNGISVHASVFTSVAHGIVMEEGRTPGRRMPPLEAIQRWVQLKVRRGDLALGDGRASEKKIRGLAFVIARSIGRKGIRPRRFMRRAGDKAEAFLNDRVNATVSKWVAFLNRDR